MDKRQLQDLNDNKTQQYEIVNISDSWEPEIMTIIAILAMFAQKKHDHLLCELFVYSSDVFKINKHCHGFVG